MTGPRTVMPWWPTLTSNLSPKIMPREGAAGFSLIEVMISMVLALITFLVMFQMFESWDRNKRSTASGGGAMVTGAMAMFRLERDLRLAGFGFGNASELGCTVAAYDSTRPNEAALNAVSATVSHAFSFPLIPLQIVDGAGGAPDQIVTLYGSAEGISGTRFFGTSAAGAQPYTATTATNTTMEVGALGGIQQGDLVVLAQESGSCDMVEVTNSANTNRRTFDYTGGNYTHFYTGATNRVPRYNNPAGISVSGATGHVYVLGPSPQRRIWQVRNNRTLAFSNDLGWTDTVINATGVAAAAPADNLNDLTDVADNIVNLQAQYGFTGTVTGTTCAASSPPTWTASAPAAPCLWNFLWAVRVGLLARSDQFEKTWGVPASGGSAVAPQWAGGSFVMTNVDGTADSFTGATLTAPSKDPNDWRHYRYRVFESIIPLKNVMWGSR